LPSAASPKKYRRNGKFIGKTPYDPIKIVKRGLLCLTDLIKYSGSKGVRSRESIDCDGH